MLWRIHAVRHVEKNLKGEMMRNFEKIITKKKRRGYDEHVELVKKQRKKRNEDKKRGKKFNAIFRYGDH